MALLGKGSDIVIQRRHYCDLFHIFCFHFSVKSKKIILKEDKLSIKITNQGFKGKGIYIGRPSPWGNPYPTKKSQFSKRVYSLKESLRMYAKKVVKGEIDISKLVEKYRDEGSLVLDCFCTNRIIQDISDIEPKNCVCHGEVLAWYILKRVIQ